MTVLLLFRRVALLVPPLLGGLLAQAQPDPIKFGKIDPSELTAKPFVADSAAPAVVLCDYGQTTFRLNGTSFQLESERITRVKILKKAGYDLATVEVPLYHQGTNEEKLVNLRGFTYNLVNGQMQKTKLETGGIFTEDVNSNVRVRKFTMPNVQEGSVIEYSYTVVSDYLFNLQPWTFQQEVPVRWSEYRAAIPEYFDYRKVMNGYLPLTVNEEAENTARYALHVDSRLEAGASRTAGVNEMLTAQVTSYRWAMKNVPAFMDEPYMTTSRDYVSRLDFEMAGQKMPGSSYRPVAGTWEKISQELIEDENFGLQLKRGNFLKPQLEGLAAKYPEIRARTAAVREVVMTAVRYDGNNRFSTTGSLRKAFDAHRGNSADVNLLLIAALRDAGVPAQPVLLSTRSHGQVNQLFAMLDKFNYVIALVTLSDGKELLVDATDPTLPCGMLPTRCLNQVGRLIGAKPEEGRWVALTPAQRRVHYQQVFLTLDAQGGLSGKVHEEHGGYAAATERDEFTQLGEKKYWAKLAAQHSSWTLPKYSTKDREEITKPFALDYEFAQAPDNNATAGTIYLSPLREFHSEQNPFRLSTRAFPVDFATPQDATTSITLTLPAGYELAEAPKPAVIDLPESGGRFLYSVVGNGQTVQLTSRMNLNRAVYDADEYEALREFYRLMLAKQAEKLVIRKKA